MRVYVAMGVSAASSGVAVAVVTVRAKRDHAAAAASAGELRAERPGASGDMAGMVQLRRANAHRNQQPVVDVHELAQRGALACGER